MPLRIGVVGCGAMGRHHVRILSGLPETRLAAVLDRDPEVQAAMAAEYDAFPCPDLEGLIERCDAAVLAVPTVAHEELGTRLLEGGLHLLIEKPLAVDLAAADRILAAAGDRVVAVGHVEFHNPAVQALIATVDRPGYIEVQRLATFSPRSLDVDVILDLMIHDLQILHALDPSPVAEIRAAGINVLSPRHDIVNARVAMESGCVASLTASRVSAQRTRKLRVFLHQRYFSLDYQSQEIKGLRLDVGAGGPTIEPELLAVEAGEPLVAELRAFVDACRGVPGRIVDGAAGRQALATALAVEAAIPHSNSPV